MVLKPQTESSEATCNKTDSVILQLQWVTQSQFAGYIAADALGYYDAACLDVQLVSSFFGNEPHRNLQAGNVDYAISWAPKAIIASQQGSELTNVAQIFPRSGTVQLSLASSNIEKVTDLVDTKVGTWGLDNGYELFAALRKHRLSVEHHIELVPQSFDVTDLLVGNVDSMQAMIYNEVAQALSVVNPETGNLYTMADFNLLYWEDEAVDMLNDGIWVLASNLLDDDFSEQTQRLVTASLEGWLYCRDNPTDCVDLVLAAGPLLGPAHQRYQLAEVNNLLWPNENGIGIVDVSQWQRTIDVAVPEQSLSFFLPHESTDINPLDFYDTAFVEAAHIDLKARGYEDLTGATWTYEPVQVALSGN